METSVLKKLKCEITKSKKLVVNYFEMGNLGLSFFFNRHAHIVLIKSSTFKNCSEEVAGLLVSGYSDGDK